MSMEQCPIFIVVEAAKANLAIAIPILLVLLGLVVVYLVYMVRAIIEMLHYKANSVLLVFSFVALLPLLAVYGILILIVWHYHKPDLLARS